MPGSGSADDLSTATAPPRTACGTSSREADVPTEEHEIEVAGCERLGRRLLDLQLAAAERDRSARRPGGREGAHVHIAALREEPQGDGADGAGRADDADAGRAVHAAVSSSKAAWSAVTARGTSAVAMWHAILIGEVEMTFDSMPMPSSVISARMM